MAREAFLINPPKRIGSAKFKWHNNSKRRRARKVLTNSWPEPAPAWRHSRAAVKGWESLGVKAVSHVRPPKSKSKLKSNPLGETLMLVGGNPPMRKRRHTKKRKGFLSFLDNPRRSHRLRHSRRRKHNPVHRRRHRRNPAAAVASGLSLKNPMSFAMPALIGVGGAIAAAYIPDKLGFKSTNTDGSTNYTALLVKAGLGVGGAMVLKGTNRIAWVAGVAAGMIAPIVEKQLGLTSTTAGLGAFLPAGTFSIPQIPASQTPAQYGAFPNEFSAYPSESITPY